jgi:hypothetical protein
MAHPSDEELTKLEEQFQRMRKRAENDETSPSHQAKHVESTGRAR